MEDQVWMNVFRMRAKGLQDEWTLHIDDSIQPKILGPGVYEYMRGSFAQFRCSGCGRSWPSKRVMVVFHFSRDVASRRGSVQMRRCKQECRRCTAPRKENPRYSRGSIDMILKKLIENVKMKCYGEKVRKLNQFPHFAGEVTGPHESAHCEACQLGICQQGK